jgi:hypothetical protein
MRRGKEPHLFWGSGLTGCAVVAVIGLQVALPALALVNDPPARFGFQMYSALGGVSLKTVDAAGKPLDVDLESIIAGALRPEFDWTGVLPERICQATPEAVRVTVEQDGVRRDVQCA